MGSLQRLRLAVLLSSAEALKGHPCVSHQGAICNYASRYCGPISLSQAGIGAELGTEVTLTFVPQRSQRQHADPVFNSLVSWGLQMNQEGSEQTWEHQSEPHHAKLYLHCSPLAPSVQCGFLL